MAAKTVYGIPIGATFLHPEQGKITIKGFGWGGSGSWHATVSFENGQPDEKINMSDIKTYERV